MDDVFLKVAFLEIGHATAQLGQAIRILLVEPRAQQLERFGEFFHCLERIAQVVQVGDFEFKLGRRGKELMEWWIHQANRHRKAFHGLEYALEVGTLDRQQTVERGGTEIEGVLSAHARGFGFVSGGAHGEDIYIPPESMRGALHGDQV